MRFVFAEISRKYHKPKTRKVAPIMDFLLQANFKGFIDFNPA